MWENQYIIKNKPYIDKLYLTEINEEIDVIHFSLKF